MPQELINILIQLPVVALFAWFFERMTNKFEDNLERQAAKQELFLREERQARDKILGEILSELRSIQGKMDEHDEKFDLAVTVMKERSAANNVASRPRRTP